MFAFAFGVFSDKVIDIDQKESHCLLLFTKNSCQHTKAKLNLQEAKYRLRILGSMPCTSSSAHLPIRNKRREEERKKERKVPGATILHIVYGGETCEYMTRGGMVGGDVVVVVVIQGMCVVMVGLANGWSSSDPLAGRLEVEATLWLLRANSKGEPALLVDSGGKGSLLLGLLGKVLVNDVVRLLVDVVVLVLLESLDLVQALRFLNVEGNGVGAVVCRVLAHLQHVLEGIQHHLDNLDVGAVKKVTERLDAATLHKVHDLLSGAARGGV